MFVKYILFKSAIFFIYLHYADADLDSNNICNCVDIKDQIISELTKNHEQLFESTDSVSSKLEHIYGTVDDINRDTSNILKEHNQQCTSTLPAGTNGDKSLLESVGNIEKRLADFEIVLQSSISKKLEAIENHLNEKNKNENDQNKIKPINVDLPSDKILTSLLETVRKVNDKLDAFENKWQNNILTKLNTMEENEIHLSQDIAKAVQDIVPRLNNNSNKIDVTSDIQNKTYASISDIYHKLAVIENITSLNIDNNEKNMEHLLFNINKNNHTCVTSQKTNEFVNNTTESTKETKIVFCNHNSKIPSLVINNNVWGYLKTPVKDEVDNFLENKTGCKYKAHTFSGNAQHVKAASFEGTALEQLLAVRAGRKVVIGVKWTNSPEYFINIGWNSNKRTDFNQYNPFKEISSLSTPGILSPDEYVPFYIKLDDNTLTFGKGCDSKPLLVHNISITRGARVEMDFRTGSYYGAKLLFDCPDYIDAGRI